MHFETGHLYHIYNQGNNRQAIFFNRDNYLFFVQKLRDWVLPHAHVVAWCLLPNHFHLLVEVYSLSVAVSASEGVTQSQVSGGVAINQISGGATLSCTPTNLSGSAQKYNDFNKSLGIMLASYTRAINKQENRSGSLFRSGSKAECLTRCDGITPSFYNTAAGTRINQMIAEEQYPAVCFTYIHQNPVAAGLVSVAEDWEFSSARDYAGLRHGTLVNKTIIERYC